MAKARAKGKGTKASKKKNTTRGNTRRETREARVSTASSRLSRVARQRGQTNRSSNRSAPF